VAVVAFGWDGYCVAAPKPGVRCQYMIKKILLAIFLIIIAVAYFVYINVQALKNPPEFRVINNTSLPISFTANWRESRIAVDDLKGKGTMTFIIRDEASMKFMIERQSGKTEEYLIGYFTGGTSCLIEVNENSADSKCFMSLKTPNKSKHAEL